MEYVLCFGFHGSAEFVQQLICRMEMVAFADSQDDPAHRVGEEVSQEQGSSGVAIQIFHCGFSFHHWKFIGISRYWN